MHGVRGLGDLPGEIIQPMTLLVAGNHLIPFSSETLQLLAAGIVFQRASGYGIEHRTMTLGCMQGRNVPP